MIKVSVIYPAGEGKTFDMEYYRTKHMDIVQRVMPGLVKVEIAVPDAERGALFRSVHPKVLRHREAPGEHDDALRRLIRRGRAGSRSERAVGHGQSGHSHPTGHRTTGK